MLRKIISGGQIGADRAGLEHGGSVLTLAYARRAKKSVVHLCASDKVGPAAPLKDCVASNQIETLNVAKPRESKEPGVYPFTLETLRGYCHTETVGDKRPGPGRKVPARRKAGPEAEILLRRPHFFQFIRLPLASGQANLTIMVRPSSSALRQAADLQERIERLQQELDALLETGEAVDGAAGRPAGQEQPVTPAAERCGKAMAKTPAARGRGRRRGSR